MYLAVFKLLFIFLYIICAGNKHVYAVVDKEIQESHKCSSIFSYFEKKYKLPKDILHSISLQETKKPHSTHNIGFVWPWTVNVEGQGFHFSNKYEALRFTKAQLRSGKSSIDVGCMQINLKYHPDAFTSVEQAFSPYKNIAYAAFLLRKHYEKHGSWDKAIGTYHSATEHIASHYQANVSKISSQMMEYKTKLQKYAKKDNRYFLKKNHYYDQLKQKRLTRINERKKNAINYNKIFCKKNY